MVRTDSRRFSATCVSCGLGLGGRLVVSRGVTCRLGFRNRFCVTVTLVNVETIDPDVDPTPAGWLGLKLLQLCVVILVLLCYMVMVCRWLSFCVLLSIVFMVVVVVFVGCVAVRTVGVVSMV